jgi:protein SCO1/2
MALKIRESWVIVALLAAGLAGGLALNRQLSPSNDTGAAARVEGLLWPNPPAIAEFSLTAKDGTDFTRADLDDRWSLMFFGFTHCPDVCPVTLRELDAVLDGYDVSSEAPQVVFVSVDPARDDAETVRRYVEFFDPAFQGVTGSTAAIGAFTRDLGVIAVPGEPDENGDYNVDHTASILVVGPDAQVVGILSAPHSAAAIRRRFEAIRAFVERQREA